MPIPTLEHRHMESNVEAHRGAGVRPERFAKTDHCVGMSKIRMVNDDGLAVAKRRGADQGGCSFATANPITKR
jgi:hypothetical protein